MSADNSVLNYCYRADGGKFSALDADKTGLIYIGSLVYKQTAGSKIEFESAAFSDGRFRRNTHSWNTNYAPEYYLKDHLGSPRAFVDWSGELIALRDYYAFGKSWLKPNSPATSDLSRFNGKEEQTVGDAGLLDYGARFYHPDLGRWLTQDPMAESNRSFNPYSYVDNNPISYIDPDGKRKWPVNPTYNGYSRRHENNYGAPRPGGRKHGGVDINLGSGNNDFGAPVFATHSGTVVRMVYYNTDRDAGGTRIKIASEDGSVETYYMHLNSIESGISVGSFINEGQQIGTIGRSGRGSASQYTAHLHYELFIDGQRVDPTYGSELIDPMSFIIGLLTTEIECIIVEVQGTGNKPSKYIINSINFDRLGKIVLHDVSTENTSLDKAVEIEKQ